LNQGSFQRTTLFSRKKSKEIITIKASKFRRAMSVITPQVCNNLSAAGKPVAKRIIAVAPNILPRIFNENYSSGRNSHTNVNVQTGSGY
jgi:hypothetical protein